MHEQSKRLRGLLADKNLLVGVGAAAAGICIEDKQFPKDTSLRDGGRQALVGIEADLWRDVTALMAEHPFDQVVENRIDTHPVAHERRYHEMKQVAEIMRELSIEPVVASAEEPANTARRPGISFTRGL